MARRVARVVVAAGVLVALALGLAFSRTGAPPAIGSVSSLPSWLPKSTIPVDRVVTASAARPWLAVEGDRAGSFTITDEQGQTHHPLVTVQGGAPLPARVAPGRLITLTVSAALPTGDGALHWAPAGTRPLVSWDFAVELDEQGRHAGAGQLVERRLATGHRHHDGHDRPRHFGAGPVGPVGVGSPQAQTADPPRGAGED